MAILILSGGSSTASGYADYAAGRLGGHDPRPVSVRGLPARALLRGDLTAPAVAELLRVPADALVVVAAVRRAATSGLLKHLVEMLDLAVPALPVAVGGFAAHARVLDHAIRPALGPVVLPTLFLPERRPDLGLFDAALDALVARKSRGSGQIAAASVGG